MTSERGVVGPADPTEPPEPRPEASLVELAHVTRLYGTVIGVNDIDVRLPKGAYGLVGPNGAGKTTLIGLLTGLLRATEGRVRVLGGDPFRQPSLLKRIGYCPSSDILLSGVSARQWLVMLLQLGGYRPREADERARDQLGRVGLAEVMDRSLDTYSLGMRQRAKFAQAIAHDPELLILDEPFNGLDPVGRYELTGLLRDWAAAGRSLLLASHVLQEVEAVTDAFLLIYGGRLLASGTAGELRQMLTHLPQEVTLAGPDIMRLAPRLAAQPWVERLEIAEDRQRLEVALREPARLYEVLPGWIAGEGLRITELGNAGGDLATLFELLTERHRGQQA